MLASGNKQKFEKKGGHQNPYHAAPKANNKEKRTCNNYGVKGHIARNCTSPPPLAKALPEREGKGQQLENEERQTTKLRLNAHERLGPLRGIAAVRGRGGG